MENCWDYVDKSVTQKGAGGKADKDGGKPIKVLDFKNKEGDSDKRDQADKKGRNN